MAHTGGTVGGQAPHPQKEGHWEAKGGVGTLNLLGGVSLATQDVGSNLAPDLGPMTAPPRASDGVLHRAGVQVKGGTPPRGWGTMGARK